MSKARHGKEILIRTSNEVGALRHISKAVAEKGIGILGLYYSGSDTTAVVHLVTNDHLRAKEALEARKLDVDEQDVVMIEVPHKPGMLNQLTDLLEQEGVNLKHLYATALIRAQRCLVIFSSSDNAKAIVVLSRE